MSALVFNNPAAWAGLAAVGAPILIHLLTRRTPRSLVFPTIRFVCRAQSNLSSLFRLRHILLLILRTLLILLVLAAFLRPVWNGGALGASDAPGGRRAAILVVDASLSMGYSRAGGGPMARARQAAQKIIDSLGTQDLCNMIVAGGMARATFDVPNNNRYQLRADLQNLQPAFERADLNAAIGEALRQLEPLTGVRKEIHFISDFQRTNWEGAPLGRIPESVVCAFISAAESNPQNVAITEIKVSPSEAVADEPVSVVLKVANYGAQTAQTPVTLKLGDEAPLERKLDLKAGAIVSTTFRIRARKTGFYEGTVQIPPDDLAADNTRHFVLPVTEKVEILALSDEPEDDPLASHRYLCRALDPFVGGRGGTIHCTVRRPDALTSFDLLRAQLVVVCGARELSPARAKQLETYLSQGGNVIVFLGSLEDKTNLEKLATLSGNKEVLPLELGGRVERGGRTDPVAFSKINFDDPLLRAFREMPEINEIKIRRIFEARPGKEAEALINYSDGNIALARGAWGQGMLLLCNFSPTPADGDLVKNALFLPLIHELCQGMRPQTGVWRSFMVGEPCAAAVAVKPKEAPPELYSPKNESLSASIDPGQTEAIVYYPRTLEPGFYRIRSGERTLAAMPVNVDARESDLDALSAKQIKDLAGKARRQMLAARAGDAGALDRMVEGRILWPALMMTALALLALEQLLTFAWRK